MGWRRLWRWLTWWRTCEVHLVAPASVQGSCATCPCGERVEIPRVYRRPAAADVMARSLIVGGRVVAIRCPTCRLVLALDDDLL